MDVPLGLCTAAIIATTTLAYTFSGTSIVFMMLLMRGGVLILAPLVDVLSRRRVAWPSWVALGLSLAAVGVATGPGVSATLSLLALVDVALYLLAYFIRLRFMSRLAKAKEPSASLRYFVEEQMVATPALVTLLCVAALIGEGPVLSDIRLGFTEVLARGRVPEELLVGVLSQGTGIFGGLILLDHRENSFCVPVNRASSILSGVVATGLLAWWLGMPGAGARELLGAALVMGAMLVLSLPTVFEALRARRAASGRVAGSGSAGGGEPGASCRAKRTVRALVLAERRPGANSCEPLAGGRNPCARGRARCVEAGLAPPWRSHVGWRKSPRVPR